MVCLNNYMIKILGTLWTKKRKKLLTHDVVFLHSAWYVRNFFAFLGYQNSKIMTLKFLRQSENNGNSFKFCKMYFSIYHKIWSDRKKLLLATFFQMVQKKNFYLWFIFCDNLRSDKKCVWKNNVLGLLKQIWLIF